MKARRLIATLALDVRVQAQSRLYAIGIFAAVLLGLGARWLLHATGDPERYVGPALAAFYLLGLGGTTMMFGASTLLMEKSQGTLLALRVSPLTRTDYVTSKLLTLSGFAAVESFVIYLGAGGWGVAPLPLLGGIVMLGVMYTYLGLGLASPHESVTSFLFPWTLLVSIVAQLPFFFVLGVGPEGLWYFIPTQAAVLLMLSATQSLEWWQWVYVVVVGGGGMIGCGWWCKTRFQRYLQLTEPT